MRGMAILLSSTANTLLKIDEIIKDFKVSHQGWKIADIDYKPLIKESFVYCGIGLIFENNTVFKDEIQRENFFKQFSQMILNQDRFSRVNNSKYYQKPLYILFLIVNQVYKEQKDYYEESLISGIDDLFALLEIFRNSEYNMSKDVKSLLEKRLRDEFLIERRKYNNRTLRDKAEFLDKILDELNINIE